MVPITKPDKYDSAKYELLVRLKTISPWKSLKNVFIWCMMPNNKTEINNRGGFTTDIIGISSDYPDSDYEKRAEIRKMHEEYTKGLFYFLGHDERVPENIRKEMLEWGYPKDEYTDNNHWSHQLYVRESRRMIGELVMTQHHCQGKETAEDEIGQAAYTMDSHNCDRLVVNGMVKNEGNVEIGGFPPYPISYRAIIPQKEEITNLLVPVCLSASHIAYGSIRMEPVFMVLAQSAAVAACISIDDQLPIQDIDVKKLQRIISENPLVDGSIPEILIDNDDSRLVEITGEWEVNYDTYRGYGSNFLTDRSGVPKSIKYTPVIEADGEYEIYSYYPKTDGVSSAIKVIVSDGDNETVKTITDRDVHVEGQTLGEWVKLGNFQLKKGKNGFVKITNEGANGVVVADAVLFLPSFNKK
jgi:hypothetical protein